MACTTCRSFRPSLLTYRGACPLCHHRHDCQACREEQVRLASLGRRQ